MMRKLIAILLFSLLTGWMWPQSTIVSTTGVIDTDGSTWAGGTYSIQFKPNPSFPSIPSYVWSGGNLQQNLQFNGTLSNSGVFSVSIPSNTAITPAGSTWTFTICPNATAGCFNTSLPVTGATQDVTTALNTLALGPRFPVSVSAHGYADVEITPIPLPGGMYYNVTSSVQRQWNGAAWTTLGGAGGSGTVQPTPQFRLFIQPNSGTNAIAGPSTTGTNAVAPILQGIGNTDLFATSGNNGQAQFLASTACAGSGPCVATIPPSSTDTSQTGLGFSSSKNSFFEQDYRKNSLVTDSLNPQIGFSGVAIPNIQSMYTDIVNFTEPTISSTQGFAQDFAFHLIQNGAPGFSNGQAPCSAGSFLFCPNPPHTVVGSWAIHNGDAYQGFFASAGINNLKTSIVTWGAIGDSQQEASFDTIAGGCVAPSDECHHWKSVHLDTVADFGGSLAAIISTGSANPSSPSPMQLTLTPTTAPGTQGQGRFLYAAPVINGTDSTPLTTAIVSLIRRPGDTYPYGTLVTQTANLPNSTAQGTLLNDCTVPVQEGGVAIGSNGATGPGAPGTAGCVVTVTTGQFCAVGSWNGSSCSGSTVVPVCMAANKWNMFDIGILLNSVTAPAGGQQTLVGTMHRSVPAGGYVFQGGLCSTVMTAQGDTNNNSGQFISASTFPFIGSFGGNTAVYLNYAASDVWQPIPNPGSQWGSRDTGNSIAHLGFTAINLTRASGVVTATITSGFQNSPQSRLMLNGAIFFSVTGCADSSFNSTAIQNFGFLTGPFPNATNQNQATFTYAQAGPDASGTCPTAVIAMQNTSIAIYPAAEVYDVQNHSTGQVDGYFATSYQPLFNTIGQAFDEPTHYQAGVNGTSVSNEIAQPLGAGNTAYASVEHNYASFSGSDFQCNNIPISFQVFSGGGTGQPLPCLKIFGPRLSDIVTDSAPFNGGAVIAVGPPQTAYNWSVNVPQFRNYTLIGLDTVSNIYRAAIGFDDDTEAFQFRFDSALGYNPSISFSPLLTNFALPKGNSFAIPVRVPELQFVSNSSAPIAHIKQCAPLSPTNAVSAQLCYSSQIPTNAVVTTTTPGSTQWIYILQVNDVAGPAYGSPMFLNNGPATLSGSVFNTIPCSDLPAGFTGIIWEFTNPLFNQVGTCTSSSTVLNDTGTYSTAVGPNGTIAGAIIGSGGFEATGLLGGFYFSQPDIYGTTTPANTITARITQTSAGSLSLDTTVQGNGQGNLTVHNLTVTGTCTGCGGGGGGSLTSFSAPSASWPSWLVPTVTNPTTTPTLTVAASAIPNSALANASTTVNGQVCVLGSTCTISASTIWSSIGNPTTALALTMAANTSTFIFNSSTGSGDLFKWTDTTGNTGTGIMGHFTTASGSTEIPWQADVNGAGWQVATDGSLKGVGASSTHGASFPVASALPTPIAGAGIYSDTSGDLQAYEAGGAFSRVCTAGNAQCSTTPLTCAASTASSICITDATYHGSAAGATTTTVSGTFTAGTTGTIASCSTFLPNNGIAIAGAGTAGALYVGTVVSCVSGTLVVTPATTTTVSSSNVVQHDESNAINAAITALNTNGGGTIFFPCGLFLANGPLLDTSGANAVITMPKVANYTGNQINISMVGCGVPASTNPASVTVIQTSQNTANFIGGYDSVTGGGFPPFTNVWLNIDNISFVGPNNPGVHMIEASFIENFTYHNLSVGTLNNTFGANTAGWAVRMPSVGNNIRTQSTGALALGGFYHGILLTEHSNVEDLMIGGVHDCVNIQTGSTNNTPTANYAGNSINIKQAWLSGCVNGISSTDPASSATHQLNNSIVYIGSLDAESNTGPIINDPGDFLSGTINFTTVIPGSGSSACSLSVLGGFNLLLNPLQCQPQSPITAGMIENWYSQENQGTAFTNSGADFSNGLTGTSTTQSSGVAGFTGKVTTYNGTSSISNAASATNTSFTGTLPFSVCATINPSTLANATVVSNLSSATGNPGFSLRTTLSGGTEFYLINNVSTNLIHAFSTATPMVANSPYRICATYDGSKTAAGVHFFINGTLETTGITTDTLTGSTASSQPVEVGGEVGATNLFTGSIGNVRIWNRQITVADIP